MIKIYVYKMGVKRVRWGGTKIREGLDVLCGPCSFYKKKTH